MANFAKDAVMEGHVRMGDVHPRGIAFVTKVSTGRVVLSRHAVKQSATQARARGALHRMRMVSHTNACQQKQSTVAWKAFLETSVPSAHSKSMRLNMVDH